MSTEIKFTTNDINAKLPTRGSVEAACYDISSVEDVIIAAGKTVRVRTGLVVADMPIGFRIAVYSRSGLAAKSSVFVLNAPGVVDSDYRGEIQVVLHNSSNSPYYIYVGDRIAQIAVEKIETDYEFKLVDVTEIVTTDRGNGGFGSTGIATAEGVIGTSEIEDASEDCESVEPEPVDTTTIETPAVVDELIVEDIKTIKKK